jgi:hypothetical protein
MFPPLKVSHIKLRRSEKKVLNEINGMPSTKYKLEAPSKSKTGAFMFSIVAN